VLMRHCYGSYGLQTSYSNCCVLRWAEGIYVMKLVLWRENGIKSFVWGPGYKGDPLSGGRSLPLQRTVYTGTRSHTKTHAVVLEVRWPGCDASHLSLLPRLRIHGALPPSVHSSSRRTD
jgi:hypothetical protein